MMEGPSLGSTLTKTQRFVLGTFVLLLVDVIWVSSSELTKYIYHNETFEKPFFCTYVKTSMFTLYFLGFCFWPPWKDYCNAPNNYAVLDSEREEEIFFSEENTSLSKPIYVPVKVARERASSTESDDSSVRSVRFHNLAEVRHMSEAEATEALLARLSYQASVRAGEYAKRAAVKLPVYRVAKIALVFCLMWFLANYTFQVALAKTEAATVTILSSTSSLFTLLLAAVFPSNQTDRFSLSKFLGVCTSLVGVILIGISDPHTTHNRIPLGVCLSLTSALFYASYVVFLRRKVDHEDKMDLPLFFGFVGFFNLVLLWPFFFFLHFTNVEKFEMPSRHQILFLLLNGLLGTVISEVLWLWGCFLTSSLVATVAMSLTIPMSMVADVFLKRISYPCLFYVGIVPMLLAFAAVTILCHHENWDPVVDVFRTTYFYLCRKAKMRFRLVETQNEQSEALIGVNEHEA